MSTAVEPSNLNPDIKESRSSPIPASVPVPTSLPSDEPNRPVGSSASNSRRGSLAAPPGLPPPPPFKGGPASLKYEGAVPKLARAASVSFIPQNPRSEGFNEETYLRHLAAATSQIQNGGSLGAARMRPDIWGNEERTRTSSWAGNPDASAGYASQQEYLAALSQSFVPQRRMSYNPVGIPAPPRSRNMSMAGGNMSAFRGSVFSAFGEGDVPNSSPDSGIARSSYGGQKSSSRRGSLSSVGGTGSTGMPEGMGGPGQFEQRYPRRFSLAPQFGSDWDYDEYITSQMETLALENYAAILNRRHSVAASAFPVRRPSPTNGRDGGEGNGKTLHSLAEFDDSGPQFNMELGDMYSQAMLGHQMIERFYEIEFKGARTDIYYIPPTSALNLKIGDLVIVEADRGKDLGKIVRENITPTELADFQQEQRLKAGDTPRNMDPKKIYRHALPNEVSLLVSKSQDEARALQLCQSKIKHHNLPMEVVDAEYQWDRRKLTFLFIAEDRVDFRELVKDLFKMYKTRIWMCAVPKDATPATTTTATTTSPANPTTTTTTTTATTTDAAPTTTTTTTPATAE